MNLATDYHFFDIPQPVSPPENQGSPIQISKTGLNGIHKLYTIKIQFVCHCLLGRIQLKNTLLTKISAWFVNAVFQVAVLLRLAVADTATFF